MLKLPNGLFKGGHGRVKLFKVVPGKGRIGETFSGVTGADIVCVLVFTYRGTYTGQHREPFVHSPSVDMTILTLDLCFSEEEGECYSKGFRWGC